MARLLKMAPWVVLVVILATLTALEGTPLGDELLYGFIALVFGPLFFLAFLLVCFCVHHWMVYGNPFHEDGICGCHRGKAHVRAFPTEEVKRRLKKTWCVECKRYSMCRRTYSKSMRLWVHVLRN